MNIYITLDYELYLGKKTGTPENCLFRPMNAIMDMLDKTGTKLTVFVDGAYLYRMDEIKDESPTIKKDLSDVLSNIKEISERGHSVQYHFHPQWLYSTYDEETGWILDMTHYKLSDVDKEKLSIAFQKGKEIIEDNIEKKVLAFRAGGYSLCSYSYYGPLFKNNGIKIDSSVLKGQQANSRFQIYDYRKTPNKSIYNFKEDVCKESNDDEGVFIEMPISSMPGKLNLYYWIKYIYNRKNKSNNPKPLMVYGDGLPVSTELSKYKKYWNIFKSLFSKNITVANLDSLGGVIFDVCSYISNQNQNEAVIIGHPKASTDISINNLERFVSKRLELGDRFDTFEGLHK